MKQSKNGGDSPKPEWNPNQEPLPEREDTPLPYIDPIPEQPAPEWSPAKDLS